MRRYTDTDTDTKTDTGTQAHILRTDMRTCMKQSHEHTHVYASTHGMQCMHAHMHAMYCSVFACPMPYLTNARCRCNFVGAGPANTARGLQPCAAMSMPPCHHAHRPTASGGLWPSGPPPNGKQSAGSRRQPPAIAKRPTVRKCHRHISYNNVNFIELICFNNCRARSAATDSMSQQRRCTAWV